VSDDQWRSRPQNIRLYIVPYWWQRPLAHQLIIVAFIVGILLLVILIIGVTKKIVTRNNEKKNLQLELELKSIYSQINPHFIFNSLSAAMYLMKINKIDDAHAHIHKFSDLLRSYIKSSRNRFIKINEEITNLKNYIELQQTRFKNKFDYEIVVDEQMDQNAKIPSLLLQPLVENAIIHGLLQRESKGQLKIMFSKGTTQNEIICTIDDNGIGRKRSKAINSGRTVKEDSYGEQLIKDLTGILNKYMKMNIEITYIDKEAPLEGTRVVLRIKENIK
jgi:LytS/YehU family sensor histidine kinase